MNQPAHVLGVDLGGTKIRGALVTTAGQLVEAETWPTLAEEGPAAVIGRIRNSVQELLQRAQVGRATLLGAGVGAPGPIDITKGIVSVLPNLPGWQDLPLRTRLEEALELPVALGNDGNAGALGEHRFGAGRGARDLVYITLGTGVGGGMIVNNRLCTGATGGAGEIGHMILNPEGPVCNCGRRGCLEAYCSGRGLERRAEEAAQAGKTTAMTELAAAEGGAITTRIIQQAATDGDPLAQELLAQAAFYLGWGMVSLVHIFNPELIVFGGGLVALADHIIEPAMPIVREWAFEQHRRDLRFSYAGLGEDAGVLGAAALALDAFGS